MREAIDGKLDLVDEAMLTAINVLLDAHLLRGEDDSWIDYDHDGNLMDRDTHIEELEAISDRMDREGGGIPAEEVHKKARAWLDSIK